MSKFKITINREPVTVEKLYEGQVEIDGSMYDFYINEYDNGDPLQIDLISVQVEDELLDSEIEDLKKEIRNKFNNEF